ncbi:hypothetical protein DACRYDRAFT_76203 [Dacryopinax primogenitus]|uniref:FAD-binding FR-type domain-containing protein n=1 Tax=Dacryopinax primogenitus (strain DJM 731) TaxID=1858805 RepID=M5G9Y0_DACPD|nr:uncharacterized protein DACRYDRAFT_76203 [Dacryopinax primogenitus]EJU05130.1 hypothetical protein DACRYDRAFT_76203 [Dacryopinax primogenitus]
MSNAHPKPGPSRLIRRAPLVLGTTLLLSLSISSYYLSPSKPSFGQTYTPALLLSHTQPTPHTSLFRLRLLRPPKPGGPFYALWVRSPVLQIEREFTPLRGLEGKGDEVELWVKREGEVARYLAGRKVGDEIGVRGWSPGVQWEDQHWDEVIMISGGTGIIPFYQLMDHLFLNPRSPTPPGSGKTKFTLLHAAPVPEELPPASMLGPLGELQRSQPDKFRLRLFVDSAPSGAREHLVGGAALPLTVRRIQPYDIWLALGLSPPTQQTFFSRFRFRSVSPPAAKDPSRKVLFLVSGPEGMVQAFAGPRARDLTEGQVGGVLGGMGYGRGEVRKL